MTFSSVLTFQRGRLTGIFCAVHGCWIANSGLRGNGPRLTSAKPAWPPARPLGKRQGEIPRLSPCEITPIAISRWTPPPISFNKAGSPLLPELERSTHFHTHVAALLESSKDRLRRP